MRDIRLIEQIRMSSEALRAEGATAIYVYGSRARGDERPDGDLDVVVDYSTGTGFSLLNLAGIHNILKERTGLDVSVTTRNSLHPDLAEGVMREAVRVY